MAIELMSQATKDQIADLERQKIALEDQLEFIGKAPARMHELEQEIFEIDDTSTRFLVELEDLRRAYKQDGAVGISLECLLVDHDMALVGKAPAH